MHTTTNYLALTLPAIGFIVPIVTIGILSSPVRGVPAPGVAITGSHAAREDGPDRTLPTTDRKPGRTQGSGSR